MGRKRKDSADNWMPVGVRRDTKGNRYIIRSKLTFGKEVHLCAITAKKSQVLAAYEALLEDGPKRGTLDHLCQQYFESIKFNNLSNHTQKDYRKYHKQLSKISFNGGNMLMNLAPQQITTGLAQKILDKRACSPTQGNREVKGFLSSVFTWALQRDLIPGITTNPIRGTARNRESGDKRYVTDDDYYYALKYAKLDQFPSWLHSGIELSYLLYGRNIEIRDLKRSDLQTEGPLMRRRKGSKSNIVGWSDRLENVINNLLALSPKIKSLYLIHDKNGQKVTYNSFRYHWDKLMAYCEEEAENDGFNFKKFNRHQLKAKGITDGEKGQNSAGLVSGKVEQDYIRKPDVVKPPK